MWVLIIITHVYGGTVATTQEFNTEVACKFAAQEATRLASKFSWHSWNDLGAVCVPKG